MLASWYALTNEFHDYFTPDSSVRFMLIYDGYIFGLLVNYLARMTVIWGKNLQNIYNIDIIC